MEMSEIEGCLTFIIDKTGCSRDIALEIYMEAANYSGGNTPDCM